MEVDEMWQPFIDAKRGDMRGLADHIESGGDLSPIIRAWLADNLRSGFPKPSRRTASQVKLEESYVRQVIILMLTCEVSEYRAMQIVLDRYPKLPLETLKGYLRNYKKKWRRPVKKSI